jgi:hypothetical protein
MRKNSYSRQAVLSQLGQAQREIRTAYKMMSTCALRARFTGWPK